MGERITGGKASESQPSIGTMVLEGARRLVALGDALAVLSQVPDQIVTVRIGSMLEDRFTYNPLDVPITRVKLIELLKAEEEHVGTQLVRILGQLYGPK